MPQPIVYVDTSAIRPGKFEELEAAMTHLTAFVEASVPPLISYGFFLDESRTHMTVVAVHPDSASLEFHMDVGGAEFHKFADLIDLLTIEVYGAISDAVLGRLHHKARMLGMAPWRCTSSTPGSSAEPRRATPGWRHSEITGTALPLRCRRQSAWAREGRGGCCIGLSASAPVGPEWPGPAAR